MRKKVSFIACCESFASAAGTYAVSYSYAGRRLDDRGHIHCESNLIILHGISRGSKYLQ